MGEVINLRERIARREQDIPTSGVIMCVRCNEPARDCRHSPFVPEWRKRLVAKDMTGPYGGAA